jgi:DMSO/TMAO reductase YedYZ molybdopterin-dependent catalytic subunit
MVRAPYPAGSARPCRRTNSSALVVRGEVDKPLQLTLADVRAMPRSTVKVREKDGTEATFEDVALAELVKRAKTHGEMLRNAANAYLIVRAADNYRVVFSLAEIDGAFTDRKILLAYRHARKAMTESQGPLRLIVPGEKVHARWVRQVRTLEIVRVGGDAKP